jgi:hypothetical protein
MKPFVVVVSLALVGGCDSQSDAPGDASHAPDASVGKPSLVVDPAMFDFGNVAAGTTSPAATFTLHNEGKAPSGSIQIHAGGNFVAAPGTCTGSLAAGESCSFTMTFSPVGLAPSSYQVGITEADHGAAAVYVRGTGVSPNQLALATSAHDFGTMVVGEPNPTFSFEVRNYAPTTTGTISVTLTGSDASSFSTTTTCTTLAPNATCTVDVTAATTTGGTKAAVLEVRGMPGGVATASLWSRLLTPATLSMTVAPNAQFGDVVVNDTVDRTFVVTNSGTQPSGPVEISLSAGDFAVRSVGLPQDCVDGTTTLSVNATCNVRVRFQPTATGSKTATLSVSASPGGEATATLTGTGLAPGQLASDTTTHDFDATEVQFLSPSTFTWNVTNTGQATTGAPSLSNNNGSDFVVVTNGCTAALAPGGTCSITTQFRPLAGGMNTGTLTLTASPGGSVGLAVKGEGLWRLSVATMGTGTVSSTGITCGTGGTNCTALFAHNSVVTLNARPANGSGFQFANWNNACVGSVNDCTLTMTGPRSTTATFTALTSNIAFVSSVNFPADLGGVAAYDNQCNALATDAGINDANGTAFKAWISDGTSNAATRLGQNTGGWRMLDNRLFARSMNDLVNNRVLNPVTITEKGAASGINIAWTATKTDGTVTTDHCTNWSSTAGNAQVGLVGDGPGRWTNSGGVNACSFSRRVYCLQTTSTTAIPSTFPPPNAKIIYYADGFTPGGGVASANAYCNAHKPPIYSTRTFRALVATSTQRIANIATAGTNYYRPDGTFVGSGSNLATGALASGIWQRDDGTYPVELVRAWSGSTGPSSFGSVTSSCNDWTYNDPGATGTEGLVNRLESLYWWAITPAISCNSTRALYCIEQ